MESIGNLRARQKYEMYVPLCYHRPTEHDPMVLREQWIRRKYEAKEFEAPDKQGYINGQMEGYMWKRGKDDKKFCRRKFILSEAKNTLTYYVKEDRNAKAVIHIDIINVTLVPEKMGTPNGMQILYDADGHTRSIYVYTEQAKDIIDWYMAIRSAKLNRLRIAYPFVAEELLAKDITHNFIKEGWLQKTGPRSGDAFRKRWISLDRRKLMYFDDPLNAFPKGEIYLGTRDERFGVLKGAPPGIKEVNYCFTLKTPERKFVFSTDSYEDRDDWIAAINSMLESPMTPREMGDVNKNQVFKKS
eukprot:GHVU01072868.1.p1 GENE.GHVU01072868.1~~GHVU01072868.1.p1  ORF type:complete len:326 (-),score=36.91 GHVU01072868.1:1703-2605(-)